MRTKLPYEKKKTPRGDENALPYTHALSYTYEKKKTPRGDENLSSARFWSSAGSYEKKKTPRGDENPTQ